MLNSRVRLIIAALMLGPVLLYWGLGIAPSERRTEPPSVLQEGEDYFATTTRTRVFNASGQLEQEVTTARLDHYPDQKVSHLTQPHIVLYSEGGATLTTNARKGALPDNRSKALLTGDVRVKDKSNSGIETNVLTEKLTLYPDTKFAETDQPVTVLSDNVRYDAVGMNASFEEQTFNLLSNVQGMHKNEK